MSLGNTHIIEESVLPYQAEDLADWKAGRRNRWLTGDAPPHVANQPGYHFGEYFVLADYATRGWSGHRFYALGDWEPTNSKLRDGRLDIALHIDQARLRAFRDARVKAGRSNGTGEPDLFLFHPNGRNMFLEVKKGRDRISDAQLQCMAQIRAILQSEVGIVYLALAGQHYIPKRYELDLEHFTARHLDRDTADVRTPSPPGRRSDRDPAPRPPS